MPEHIVSTGTVAFQANAQRIRVFEDVYVESDAQMTVHKIGEMWDICWKAKLIIVLLVIGYLADRLPQWFQ